MDKQRLLIGFGVMGLSSAFQGANIASSIILEAQRKAILKENERKFSFDIEKQLSFPILRFSQKSMTELRADIDRIAKKLKAMQDKRSNSKFIIRQFVKRKLSGK